MSEEQVRIRKILNKDFVRLSVDAISTVTPNLNNSAFTKGSLDFGVASCFSKPILGSFKESAFKEPDFQGHEGIMRVDKELLQTYWDNKEIPLGVVRDSDKVEVIEKDGLYWLRINCVLWTTYNYKAVKAVLKSKKKKVSVEIEVIDSEPLETDGETIEVIKRFNLRGITILGDNYSEAIPGAEMTVLDVLESALYSKKLKCLQFAYDQLDKSVQKQKTSIDSPLLNEPHEGEDGIEGENANMDDSQRITDSKIPLKEGGHNLLTLGQRREVLEPWLREHSAELPHMQREEGDEDACYTWVWVADLDDTMVYFETDAGTYRAPYMITESDEGRDVEVNLEEIVKVIRDWTVFTEGDQLPDASAAQTSAEEGGAVTLEVFNELQGRYDTLNEQFMSASQELDAYHEAEEKAKRDALAAFGCGLVDAEKMFTAEDAACVDELKNAINTSCADSKFSTEDEVRTFAEDLLAKAVYQKIKSGTAAFTAPVAEEKTPEPDGQKEFSAQIVKDSTQTKRATAVSRLKEYNSQR